MVMGRTPANWGLFAATTITLVPTVSLSLIGSGRSAPVLVMSIIRKPTALPANDILPGGGIPSTLPPSALCVRDLDGRKEDSPPRGYHRADRYR